MATIDDESRPMEDEDWLMLGLLMDQELDAKSIVKNDGDVRATRKRLTKRLKHYTRDNGQYEAMSRFEKDGEKLSLHLKEEGSESPGVSSLEIIHLEDEANDRYAQCSMYDIMMDGDEQRTLRVMKFRVDKLADDQERNRLEEQLDTENEMGLQQPTQEDFQEAIALIERFTKPE